MAPAADLRLRSSNLRRGPVAPDEGLLGPQQNYETQRTSANLLALVPDRGGDEGGVHAAGEAEQVQPDLSRGDATGRCRVDRRPPRAVAQPEHRGVIRR